MKGLLPEHQKAKVHSEVAAEAKTRLPVSERPLVRLERKGSRTLSTAEVLAIVIGGGGADAATLQLAHILLSDVGDVEVLAGATSEELMSVQGVGRAGAGKIRAALELGQRVMTPYAESPVRIQSSAEAADWFITELLFKEQEHVCTMLLTARNTIIDLHTVYIGAINTTPMRIGELFKQAIRKNAASIIVAHNHPSGDPTPSDEDVRTTRELIEAGDLLGINVKDHIVVAGHSYVSMR